MSKVIILSDRNNHQIKYDKKLLFKSRLEINSSRRKNYIPLSISNNQSNTNKKSSYIKDNNKNSLKKEQLKPYNHKKNITYINGNNSNNFLNDFKFNSKKYINIKNYNSTFNNFAKNIKHDLNKNNNNKENYFSNKTFMKKNLNNSVIGKNILREKKMQNFEKLKNIKNNKNDDRSKKRIMSLSNSLSKSSKIKSGNRTNRRANNININNLNQNFLNINKNNSIINHISYNNTIITANYPKLPIKEFNKNKNHKKNNSKRNNKGIYSSFNSFHNKKYGYEGKSEENQKDKKIYNLNIGNKMKLKKFNLDNAKINKVNNKYNHKHNNKKIQRNAFQSSCKEINKTEINTTKNEKEKQRRKKEKNININSLNNIDIIKYNLNENDYKDEKDYYMNDIEEIKVNKLDDVYYLSENSKIINIINCDSDNEEEKEDSNILSLDDVQDIIKYYDFEDINKEDNFLFHYNDYVTFRNHKKNFIFNDFFNETQSSNIFKAKIKQKNSNKKKLENKNLKISHNNFNISSPSHLVYFDKKYKTFKK